MTCRELRAIRGRVIGYVGNRPATFTLRCCHFEAVEVHHLVPGRDEVVDEFLFCSGAEGCTEAVSKPSGTRGGPILLRELRELGQSPTVLLDALNRLVLWR